MPVFSRMKAWNLSGSEIFCCTWISARRRVTSGSTLILRSLPFCTRSSVSISSLSACAAYSSTARWSGWRGRIGSDYPLPDFGGRLARGLLHGLLDDRDGVGDFSEIQVY